MQFLIHGSVHCGLEIAPQRSWTSLVFHTHYMSITLKFSTLPCWGPPRNGAQTFPFQAHNFATFVGMGPPPHPSQI